MDVAGDSIDHDDAAAAVDYGCHSASLGLDSCGRPDVHPRLVVVQVAVGMVKCLEAGHRAEVAHLTVFGQGALAVNAGGWLEENVAHSVAVVCFGGGCLRVGQSRPWGWFRPHPGLKLLALSGNRVSLIPSSLCHSAELAICRILKIDAQVLERALKSAKDQLEVLGAFDFPGLLHHLDRRVHVSLWFAAVSFDSNNLP